MNVATVRLGEDFYDRFGGRVDPPVVFSFAVPVEFSPDEVFAALNRVCDLVDEPTRLTTDWQMSARARLDDAQAPSMSVGDSFTVYSDAGFMVGRWVCDRTGWTVGRPGREET